MMSLWCAALGTSLMLAGPASARNGGHETKRTARSASSSHATPAQHGHASIYASHFRGRRMADGTRFDPAAATVASRTLPLGSRARVTNLRNGRTMMVRVTDRGPHIRRRILDVSPGVARQLGMGLTGTAPVSVTPVLFAAPAEARPTRPSRRR